VTRACFVTAVLLLTLTWGVTATSLCGKWETIIDFDPSGSVFKGFLEDISSTLTMDYTLDSWVLGSESVFNLSGFGLQKFTASGKLDAFTIDSTLQFDPMITKSATYALASGESYQTQSVASVSSTGTPATWSDLIWNCAQLDETITYTQSAFSSLKANAQVSLLGMNFEWLFYLKGNDFETKTVTGKWVYGDPYDDWENVVTQTGSYTASACLPRYGAGSKLTLSGTAGDMLITSHTYFNLEEYSYNELMTLAYAKTYIKDTFKLGGSYYLPRVTGETWDATFTREFITLEGMSLGCAEFSVGLNMTCEGFDWFKILVTDIKVFSFLSLDTLITFTTTEQEIFLEPVLCLGDTGCITIHLDLDWDATAASLNGLIFNGISTSYNWNGLTFSSATSFNPVLGPSGYYLAADVNSRTTYGFFIPDKNFAKEEFDWTTGVGYYTEVCYPEEYYDIWEMFTIETSAEGCCGGGYKWEVNTYFGDRKTLIADSFWFWYKDEDGNSYAYNTTNTPAKATPPTVSGSAKPYCEDDDVNYGVAYYDADENTLFGWVKTDMDLVIPISSCIHLTFGMAVNVYGWDELELGFVVSW